MTADAFLAALGEAAAGLLFPSESDAPLTPYRWPARADEAPTPEALLRVEGQPPDTPVEVWTLRDLFGPLIEEREGAIDEEREDAARYGAIVALLERELRDLRVFRVGKVEIGVYVLGLHPAGEWLGLETRVVET